MAKFLKWFTSAVETFVDPDKQRRVETLTTCLQTALSTQRQAFSLWPALAGQEYNLADLEQAKHRVYRAALERGWSDGLLNADEQKLATWIAQRLEMPPETAQQINQDLARQYFGVTLAKALEDGRIDDREVATLQGIAASVGKSMPEFSRTFFHQEGEAFLRSMFLACVADGRFSQDDWLRLVETGRRLGIDQAEFHAAIQVQAQQFVEHVLADAKNDRRLTETEEGTLNWLVTNLGLTPAFRQYVQSEVWLLKSLTQIENCRLPSLPVPVGIETRSGEIVHLHVAATWREVRLLKSGPHARDHVGTLTLTDNRLMFASSTKAYNVSYRKIVSHRGAGNWIEVQVEGKAASAFHLHESSPLAYPIFRTAVAMANQTRTATIESAPSRHIARDVRQRVWQRYGGRCADCNASDYIEFDHIIPIARGGSSGEGNVQLLCRRCNGKKSDNI